MSEIQMQPFERQFHSSDVALFAEMTRGILGKPLSRWRETYAQGLVMDFGMLIPREASNRRTVYGDRGEWTVSSWGCDIMIREMQANRIMDSFELVKAEMKTLLGDRLVSASIDPDDLSLSIDFEHGTNLIFRTDFDDRTLDQWFIQDPEGNSIGVAASGQWYLRPRQNNNHEI